MSKLPWVGLGLPVTADGHLDYAATREIAGKDRPRLFRAIREWTGLAPSALEAVCGLNDRGWSDVERGTRSLDHTRLLALCFVVLQKHVIDSSGSGNAPPLPVAGAAPLLPG